MPKKTGTIHIKWVRSGIGFSRKQKEVVASIGLQRLNQIVERPDTVQFRGLVAKVSHLVEIVEPSTAPVWTAVPENTIIPAGSKPKAKPAAKPKAAAVEKKAEEPAPAEKPAAPAAESVAVTDGAVPAKKPAAPRKRAAKSAASSKAAGTEKPKRKAAASKTAAKKEESKSKKGNQ